MLLRTYLHLLSCFLGQSRLQQFNRHIDVLYELVTYAHKLLTHTDHVQLIKEEDAEQVGLLKVALSFPIKKFHKKNNLRN